MKRGEKGDATVLKPSIMFCVPLILDRIYKVSILLMLLMILLVLMFFVQFILGSGQNGENNSLFQGVTDQIRRKGEVVSDILDFLIQYKIDCVKRAEPTPIMDR